MNNAAILSFVLRARNRLSVLNALIPGRMFSTQIEQQTGMYKSHVSRALSELGEKKLTTCINPQDRSYKFYKLTPYGKRITLEANKLLAMKVKKKSKESTSST